MSGTNNQTVKIMHSLFAAKLRCLYACRWRGTTSITTIGDRMIMNTIILKRAKACCNALVVGMLLSILPATAWSAQAIINPSQDNTLAEELPDNSSGACESIFSGMIDVATLDGARRAMVQFDLADIPPGPDGFVSI